MKNKFIYYHPISNIIFFLSVILITCLYMNPIIIGISFVGASIYLIWLKGFDSYVKSLLYLLIMALFIIIINPLFNHKGITSLYRFKNGNELTLESIIYGCFMALMVSALILWFQCYNKVMTSDKFIYLTGKIAPRLGLVLSMILRYVPLFKLRYTKVKQARETLLPNNSNGFYENAKYKIKTTADTVNAMIGWSMENSIETSDSMNARGYGRKDRSSYSIYTFRNRDRIYCGFMIVQMLLFIILVKSGCVKYWYYPYFYISFKWEMVAIGSMFTLVCIIPVLIDLKKNG